MNGEYGKKNENIRTNERISMLLDHIEALDAEHTKMKYINVKSVYRQRRWLRSCVRLIMYGDIVTEEQCQEKRKIALSKKL